MNLNVSLFYFLDLNKSKVKPVDMSKVKPVEESKSVKKEPSTHETKSIFSSEDIQPKTASGEQGRVIF